MGKQVIVTKEDFPRVFRTLEEASEQIGASVTAISMAIRENRECKGIYMRYVDRIFLVRKKGENGIWRVAKQNLKNTAYYSLDQKEKPIPTKTVEEIKDITPIWYFSKEEW